VACPRRKERSVDRGLRLPHGGHERSARLIAVLDYGIGNLRSAEKALVHLGADAHLVTDPEVAAAATGVVMPGVGAFGPCADALRRTGMEEVALDAIARGVPFLGICVGFQLLYEGSDEAPGVPGLGVLGGTVRSLPAGVKRPQMQWNRLHRREGTDSALLTGLQAELWVYFVHSFAPQITEDVVATCDYGGEVVAAAERGCVWGTQFHPEKSGAAGLRVLGNFVTACTTGPSTGATIEGSQAARDVLGEEVGPVVASVGNSVGDDTLHAIHDTDRR
jgi:glutamine amidotransferase